MSRHLLCIASCILFLPAFASNPGEPLDCSDWVFLEPGFSCSVALAFPCDESRRLCVTAASSGAVTNEGGTLLLNRSPVGVICDDSTIYRTELTYSTPQSEVLIGYVEQEFQG